MTNQEIEQKKKLLADKMKQMKAIYDELVEAGSMEISEDELDQIGGGFGGIFATIAGWFGITKGRLL